MNGKFRVWNKTHKMYHDFEDLVIDMQGRFLDRDRRVLDPSENEVEFSMGLKDKNGKEIFEGDIIHNKTDDYERDMECIWSHVLAGFYFIIDRINWHTAEDLDEFEIIGNIHEVKQ